MSNLKDTDIDDLFRRASEKYPLRTDSSDWDGMAAALEKDPPPPDDGTDTTDRRRKRRFFWLFLLLPLGVGGLGYYAWHSGARMKAGTTAKVSVVTNTAAGANAAAGTITAADANTAAAAKTPTVNTTSDSKTRAANPTAASGAPAPTVPTTTAGGTTAAAKRLATNRVDRSLLANAGRQTNTNQQGNSNRAGGGDHQANAGHQAISGHQINAGHQGNAAHLPEAGGAFADASTRTSSGTNAQASGSNALANGSPFPASLTQRRQDRLFYDLQREPVDRNYQLKVNVAAPAAKKDSSAAKQKTTSKTKTSYLYAGLIAAPDLSTVKMQGVKGVGNTFGALIGYAFNPHWAIESGVYLDRKRYYTEGQYFKAKEVGWANDTLKNVDGTCYMWEIPLNLRYTFNPGAKTRWFVTAGLTTYLMTKEKYTYNYEVSGWAATSKRIIDTASQYPFSVIGLSAGFEQRLGKVGNLRIEPYLRIPLTGMGAGKLPIMSTGINIGITRQLWKK